MGNCRAHSLTEVVLARMVQWWRQAGVGGEGKELVGAELKLMESVVYGLRLRVGDGISAIIITGPY